MARLEYRLNVRSQDEYPVLYTYDGIAKQEIAMRFVCDYWVKKQVVYEMAFCAIADDTYVIYVNESDEEYAVDSTPFLAPRGREKEIAVELREHRDFSDRHPHRHTFYYASYEDALLCLKADFIKWDGTEWEKTSSEVDEDRLVYVFYGARKREYF